MQPSHTRVALINHTFGLHVDCWDLSMLSIGTEIAGHIPLLT